MKPVVGIFNTLDMIRLFAAFLLLRAIFGLSNLESIADSSNLFWAYYVDESHERLVAFQVKGDEIVDCYISGDKTQISILEKTLEKIPGSRQYTENKEDMRNISSICNEGKTKGMFSGGDAKNMLSQFGMLNVFFIYPGTKYCGAGNISESYDDLGEEVEADKCCRAHDSCNDNILAFKSKHGLKNPTPITKSHCDCDECFFNCLKEANTKTSNRLGRIYFNALQMECFRKDYPIESCKKYRGLVTHRCEEYELNHEKEPVYQYFDDQYYEAPSEDSDEANGNKDVFYYLLNVEDELDEPLKIV
ncbi:uncharacterized protein [Parasteatoda tepidariorum]|uniref:uncharacterized protein isoform X2 n=1 Tax=Parasteatoda tepidariorum TaxID=114398 RepID=UPI001C71DE48|nr:uncharacterized protein LOC107453256 isoform X1 [Parasteatoda tepidariorum]